MWTLLWLGLLFSVASACGCGKQWERTPEGANLNIFINKTMPGQYEMLTWQWLTKDKDSVWTVSLKRWPKLEFATGSVKLKKMATNTESYLGWKVKKTYLTWSGKKGVIFEPEWNLTICNLNINLGFIPERFGLWTFRLGNATLSGDVGSINVKEITKKKCSESQRHKRAPDDDAEEIPPEEGDGTQRKSFIKWILRKTGLQQGDNDQRNWWERVADLIIGWFKGLFT